MNTLVVEPVITVFRHVTAYSFVVHTRNTQNLRVILYHRAAKEPGDLVHEKKSQISLRNQFQLLTNWLGHVLCVQGFNKLCFLTIQYGPNKYQDILKCQ